MRTAKVSRRTVLRGLGAAVALPLLEGMMPTGRAAARAAGVAAAGKHPLRTAFLFFPNGAIMPAWEPVGEGQDFQFGPTHEPLKPFKNDLLLISGLAHDKARANGDGGGDHARSCATFLTGRQARKTAGADISVGISVDQLAAQKIGGATRFASLELGCERSPQAGSCDSGYSCAYSGNIAWRSPNTPVAKEVNPRLVFERLFGAANDGDKRLAAAAQAKRLERRKSVLDYVRDDAATLRGDLGRGDQRKLDEYLDSVREIERQIQSAEAHAKAELAKAPPLDRPEGIPNEFAKHIRLMFDLMAVAFQTDLTRVATFMFANEGSNRSFNFLGVSDGHHHLSHHDNDKERIEKIKKIDRFYVQEFAYFLQKLKGTAEGEGNLLDHSQILMGCSISDGNRHSHGNLPLVLAGQANGAYNLGRHVRYAKDTPLCNLFLDMLDRVGVKEDRFGDSTGRLGNL